MRTTTHKNVLLQIASVAALIGAGACSSGSSGGLSFGESDTRAGGASGASADGGGAGGADGSVADGSASGGIDGGGGAGGSGGSGTDVAGGGGSAGGGADGGLTPASSGTLQRMLDGGDPLFATGSALLPGAEGALDDAAAQGDALLDPAAKVTLASDPVVGSSDPASSQLVGVSATSANPAEGDVATVNALEGGQVVNTQLDAEPLVTAAQDAGVDTSLADNQQIVAGDIDDTAIASDPALVDGSVLTGEPANGDLAGVNVLTGDDTVSLQVDDQQIGVQ